MVTFEEQGDVLIISLIGEMTISRISLFKDKIDEHKIDNYHKIVINLDRLTFIDSSGLGTLVLLTKEVKNNFGSVVLTSPQSQVNKLLDMVKINKYVEVKPSIDEAMLFIQSETA